MVKKNKIDQEIEKEVEKERLRTKKLDEIQKKNGRTHKITAWIHPKMGDDMCIDIYFQSRPEDREIRAFLKKRGSEVLTDYQVIEL